MQADGEEQLSIERQVMRVRLGKVEFAVLVVLSSIEEFLMYGTQRFVGRFECLRFTLCAG